MRKCVKHPHSSDATAQKCFAKYAGKRADRVIEKSGLLGARYQQVKCDPPAKVAGRVCDVHFFYTAKVKW